mgnify:CR=1 FL=1
MFYFLKNQCSKYKRKKLQKMTEIKEPLRVLHIGADNIGYGGRSVIAFNLTQNMNHKIVVNDFLTFKRIEDSFADKIAAKGGNVITILLEDKRNKLRFEYERTGKMIKKIKYGKYDIVHIHADHAYEAMKSVWIAGMAGVKKFVIHGHSAGSEYRYTDLKKLLIVICQYVVAKSHALQLACSEEAAVYLFGRRNKNSTYIIRNGIKVSLYQYSVWEREEIRKCMGYETKQLIIGCVGRFSYPKNHRFLIEIFENILKRLSSARLILVGDGELKAEIEKIAREKEIYNSIDFLGNRNDVPKLLQAMDVFVLPSIYEGFGIVNLEAQCSGLPCVVSDKIPKSVKVTELVTFLSLEESAEKWADTVINTASGSIRKSRADEIAAHGFDIANSGAMLEKYYDRLGRNK